MSKKTAMLELLLENDIISGGQIAAKLDILPDDVLTFFHQLELDGCSIGVSSHGFHLISTGSLLSVPAIKKHLKNPQKYNFEIFDTISSTNDRAKELAHSGAPEFTVILADEQTGGRGRMGRSFFAPSRSGVYLTLLLRPDISPEKVLLITTYTAVAVSRAIKSICRAEAQIKWVNDLLLNGKKICGILSESGFENGKLSYVAVGIGINVTNTDFPEDICGIATSIEKECGLKLPRSRLIAAILTEMEGLIENLETGRYMDEYRRRSIILGHEVTVSQGSNTFCAKAEEIDDNGALIVSVDGERRVISSGDVSIRLK